MEPLKIGITGVRGVVGEALTPELAQIHEELTAGRRSGKYAFLDLPYDLEMVKTVRGLAKPLLEWCWEFIVLGLGGSALGARALFQALCHPQHNMLPVGRKKHHPGLWVLDNIDPLRRFVSVRLQQGVPQTLIGGEMIVGFDTAKINRLLEIQG